MYVPFQVKTLGHNLHTKDQGDYISLKQDSSSSYISPVHFIRTCITVIT